MLCSPTERYRTGASHCIYVIMVINFQNSRQNDQTLPRLPKPTTIIYLVVWNLFYFSIYWEFHHPNCRTHIFQRGRLKPPTSNLYNFTSSNTNVKQPQASFGIFLILSPKGSRLKPPLRVVVCSLPKLFTPPSKHLRKMSGMTRFFHHCQWVFFLDGGRDKVMTNKHWG